MVDILERMAQQAAMRRRIKKAAPDASGTRPGSSWEMLEL
jgi:hypothetical protein